MNFSMGTNKTNVKQPVAQATKKDTKSEKKAEVKEMATSEVATQEDFELSTELSNAIKWMGRVITGSPCRLYVGTDGKDYVSCKPRKNIKLPEGYEAVGDIAEDILESLSELREEVGMAIFATYGIPIERKNVTARLIKALHDDNDRLILGAEIEHIAGRVTSSITTMVPRNKTNDDDDESNNDNKGAKSSSKKSSEETNFGFSKLR